MPDNSCLMHRGIWEGFGRLKKERRTKVKKQYLLKGGERQALGEIVLGSVSQGNFSVICNIVTNIRISSVVYLAVGQDLVCRETAPHLMIGTEHSAGMLWLLVIIVVSRVEFGKEGQKEEEEEEEEDLWTLDTE
ncbi:hypothetical protein AO1008_08952 [Aspergillus oryzae 100-8]|nr:hypothetical protein AO1008_08952 [Aspergillus oryzae 100-8]